MALAQQVARSENVAAPLPVFLITGMKEAEEWNRDDGEQIEEHLRMFGCAEGISRVERLGRRQRNHPGGGRFILAEFSEVGAQRLREAKESMEKKGIRVRVAEGNFRFRAARPQLRRAPPVGPSAPSANAHAGPLVPPGLSQGDVEPPPANSGVQRGQAKVVCKSFQKGECPDVRRCEHAHVRVCIDFANSGRCRFGDKTGNGCRFHHIKWDEDVGGSEWRGANKWNRARRSSRDRNRDVRGMAPPSGHGRDCA